MISTSASVLLGSMLGVFGASREVVAISATPDAGTRDESWHDTQPQARAHRFAAAPAASATASDMSDGASENGERKPLFSDRVRDGWLLSAEAVTHAPLDVGAQLGVETPFGLRLFAGYGWVPSAYIGTLTGIAASATDDTRVSTLLESADYTGRTARVTIGVRPFRRIGLYVDAGYSHATLEGSRALPEIEIPGYGTLRGAYRTRTGLDLWLVELGYQFEVSRRLVLAGGLGVAGTFDAKTTITPVGGAPSDPVIAEAARRVDRAFETYGIVPTLTLRIGFDLI